MDFSIDSMGVDTHHGVDEVIDRPEGMPHYLLACFSTPFIGLENGGNVVGEPGDCLLRRPNVPDYFASIAPAKEGFRGDWLHLRGTVVEQWIETYDAPINRYVSTGHPHYFTELARAVMVERRNQGPFCQHACARLVERMILLLSRADRLQDRMAGLSPSEEFYYPQFIELRERLRSHPSLSWTSSSIAKEVGLSNSRTCALYRRFFGVPPVEDVLLARIELAKDRLVNGTDSVGAITEACGFSSIYHFSRMFKRKVGASPTQYAKTCKF